MTAMSASIRTSGHVSNDGTLQHDVSRRQAGLVAVALLFVHLATLTAAALAF